MDEVLLKLLDIGRNGEYFKIANIPSLQDHHTIARLIRCRGKVISFAKGQTNNDRIALLKSIAMLEQSVGNLGSITLLQFLFPLVPDPDSKLLDWVLRNTESFWYYAHGARSVEELRVIRKMRAEITAESIERDAQRQRQDKKRIAETATNNLFNSVRRGDIKAVRALIGKGANVNTSVPNGMSLWDYAVSHGFNEIAVDLQKSSVFISGG